jgi:hypothetical protein
VAVLPGLFTDTIRTIATFFVVNPRDGDTESGLGLILFTFPVIACCAYSAGIGYAGRRRERQAEKA